MDDNEQRLVEARRELLAQQSSNAETYDRSILTLSSAFLAFSVTLISNVVKLADAHYKCWLFASWISFAAAIIVTIVSFMYGQKVIQELLTGARAFHIDRDEKAYARSEVLAERMAWINGASGVLFIAGIVCTVVFAITNVGGSMAPRQGDIERHAQPVVPFDRPAAAPAATVPEAPPATPTGPPAGSPAPPPAGGEGE